MTTAEEWDAWLDRSQLDTARFGVPSTRIFPKKKSDLLRNETFVIARIDTNDIALAQHAESVGYRLCDTLVYWRGPCVEYVGVPHGYTVRPLTSSDRQTVEDITKIVFRDYPNHYYNDVRTRSQALSIYIDWATSLKDGMIYEKDSPVAYALFGEPCELVLGGVLPEHRGSGLYRNFVQQCMSWGLERGIEEIEISTQISNLSVQRVWASLGMKPHHSYFTYHYWQCA